MRLGSESFEPAGTSSSISFSSAISRAGRQAGRVVADQVRAEARARVDEALQPAVVEQPVDRQDPEVQLQVEVHLAVLHEQELVAGVAEGHLRSAVGALPQRRDRGVVGPVMRLRGRR